MTPTDVTRSQIERLEVGDEGAAGALLSPEARVRAPQWPARADLPTGASVVEVERTARWEGTRELTRDGGQAVAGSPGFAILAKARELELVRTGSGWGIRRGVLALFAVDSADGALSAFGRALEARDIGLVLALLPEESRRLLLPGTFEDAFAAREAAWRELGRAIGAQRVTWATHDGDRAEAVVTVGDGKGTDERHLMLVREVTGWKVFDVQPWSGYIAP